MSDELETLRHVREAVEAPDPALRAAARSPWDGELTDTVDAGGRRNLAFGWRVAIAAAAVAALAAGSFVVMRQRIDSVKPQHVVAVTSLPHAAAPDPSVFLFVGSDSRAFVQTPSERDHFGNPALVDGARSDTMILVRVDPRTGKVLVVSLPRDLFVTIPGCGTQKINAAFNADLSCGTGHGGTQLLVDTITTAFSVPINHVIEVQFPQFAALVDQLGGLRIQFPTPARDTFTGLDEPAGCTTLTGSQALAFVRSRHYESFDGAWRYDPTADLGRMTRQQLALRQLAAAAESRVGTDPRPLLRALFAHITVDSTFTADDALRFYGAMRAGHATTTLTLPTETFLHGDQFGLELAPGASAVLKALATGSAVPSPPTPASSPARPSVFQPTGC